MGISAGGSFLQRRGGDPLFETLRRSDKGLTYLNSWIFVPLAGTPSSPCRHLLLVEKGAAAMQAHLRLPRF